jgi:hypothetical protein
MTNELIERLERNAGWRNADWECVTDPNLLTEAAAEIKRLRATLEMIANSNATDMETLHPDGCANVARAALE